MEALAILIGGGLLMAAGMYVTRAPHHHSMKWWQPLAAALFFVAVGGIGYLVLWFLYAKGLGPVVEAVVGTTACLSTALLFGALGARGRRGGSLMGSESWGTSMFAESSTWPDGEEGERK